MKLFQNGLVCQFKGLLKKDSGCEGLIIEPSEDLKMDVCMDADFAGLWPHEDKPDPMCVKSRTGFVI